MEPFKAGKIITYVAIAIFLIVAIISPYELPKKILFIIFVIILGVFALSTNKLYEWIFNKIKNK
ncbi:MULTISPECIES: hypothetical protein [unclassified Bacillus (in: firmicutes)]|uniref:hypothetical protein n=1 Tax=unclassified Bacillus (in: firmicutes) TaxID=185979 RepID=UPI003D25D8D0